MGNPFKPTAGKNPPVLIGRDYILDEFDEGIENGSGAPGRLMRITGMRGMGKTVMLNEIARRARSMGWAVIEETASPGFCERILDAATPAARVSKLNASPAAFGFSLGTVEVDRVALSLRDALSALAKGSKGVLITLDEVQDASLDEMRALSVAVQHEIREDVDIAFVFAGLPSMIENVVNGKTLTFLRRATPVDLGPVGIEEVGLALGETIRASGMTIESDDCKRLAEASRGYPFMVQLVGYHVWQVSHRVGKGCVTAETVESGLRIARERFDVTVIEPALQRLPTAQIDYLIAMAEDGEGPSDTSAIAGRLGKTAQQVGPYRARLIAQDVIENVSWGKVGFAIPYMSDYLNTHREELGR